jgi:membrane protein insertase Oxa1/YidC/SpoIIIJ
MTGSSLSQQLIFGTGSPGQNNKMMAFMPVFMLFIFYGMPSGLVLYWLCNDIMTFAHRYFIKQRQDKKAKDQDENEGKVKYDAKNKIKAKNEPNKTKKQK